MIESTLCWPLFRVLIFGILCAERLIDAQQGTYAIVPTRAFRKTYPWIVLRSLLCGPMRSLWLLYESQTYPPKHRVPPDTILNALRTMMGTA